MNRNRQLLIGLISILLLVFVFNVNVLAQVAKPQGYISDQAQMLTNSEKNTVEQAINTADINVYVYTTRSLQGESIGSLAEAIFDDWQLNNNEALLLIAYQDQEVQLQAGQSLDRLIANGTGANAYTAFLDQHFIPHAMDGDFAQAIVATVHALATLQDTSGPTGVTPPPTLTPTPNENRQAASEGTTNFLLPLLIIAAIIFIGILLFGLFLGRKEVKAQHEKLMAQHQNNLVAIHQLEQELEPIIQFSRGKSEALIKNAKGKFYDLLQQATKFTSDLNSFTVPFWSDQKQTKAQLANLSRQIESFSRSIADIQATLDSYKQVEKTVTPLLESCQKQLTKAEGSLQQLAEQLKYPLDHLFRQKDALKNTLESASRSIQFDPLEVQDLLKDAPEEVAALQEAIEKTRDQAAAFKKLPEKLKITRQTIDEWTEHEQLLLTEITPYSSLDNVQEQLGSLERSLQAGDIRSSTSTLNQMDEWLQDAVEQVKRHTAARDWLMETVGYVELENHKFDHTLLQKLKAQIEHVQSHYHPEQWEAHLKQLQLIEQNRLKIAEQLPEVKHFMDASVQKYFAGERLLTQLVSLLEANQGYQREILTLQETLAIKSKALNQTEQQLSQKIQHISSLMQHNGIGQITSIQHLQYQVAEKRQSVHSLQKAVPLHLTALEQALQHLANLVNMLESEVQTTIQAKNQAEQAQQKFVSAYSSAISRYGRKVKRSYYENEYHHLLSQMETALALGEFNKVTALAASGEQLINRMMNEYQKQVNLERQIALQRQRQLQRRQMQTWGGGATGGSRHRPGSSGGNSGWGGSSGGGSGFSRSSGGRSGWGSSGRSGGSRGGGGGSKW